MSRPRLRRPDQPLPLQWILGLYEFLASLKLAVILLATYFLVLAWGTIYIGLVYGDGDRVINFAIYDTWWFALLNGMLGVNVLCAALIRFPWKRHQIGFVITHAGILLLMSGALISRLRGIDANLPVVEGQSAGRAVLESRHFDLKISPDAGSAAAGPRYEDVVRIPFESGPFNWGDYRKLFWFPWALAHRDQGVVYDRDGVRLEVLDYYSDSRRRTVPQVVLRAAAPAESAAGRVSLAADETVTLSVRSGTLGPRMPVGRFGLGEQAAFRGGQQVAFWMTGDAGETAAFGRSAPEGPLGPRGQVVLVAQEKRFILDIDKLQKELAGAGQTHPLGDTGLKVVGVRFEPRFISVQLTVRPAAGEDESLILFASVPEFNRQAYGCGVYGAYWFDPDSQDATSDAGNELFLRKLASPRVDVLQGADRKLYARAWRAGKVAPMGELPVDGEPRALWANTDDALALVVDDFVSAQRPDIRLEPLAFSPDKKLHQKQPQVRVRLTVDGHAEEFWLPAGGDVEGALAADGAPGTTVAGQGRRAQLSVVTDSLDLGFGVFLHEFQRKLDPGTSTASHYASRVDFVDVDGQSRQPTDQRLRENVLISMNEPADFSDVFSRKSYRLYQSSFAGPYKPGDEAYAQLARDGRFRDQIFISHLSVNYDPGRGWKYLGSLMIVAGILTMFYMKAYFFRRGK